MVAARWLVGFGAGNAAIVRSYVSAATTEAERVGAFAGISASQAVGFILGPVLGLAFVPLHKGIKKAEPYFFFNMYTGPAFLSAVLAIINILLVLFLFKESKLIETSFKKMKRVDRSQSQGRSAVFSINSGEIEARGLEYDLIGAFICLILFFIIMFMFAVFETIITPYSMDEFAWSKDDGVLYNGIMFGALAILAIVAFIGLKFISKYVDNRVVLVCGLFLAAFGFYVLIPMGNEMPAIGIEFIKNSSVPTVNSSWIPLSPNATTIPVGCRYPKLIWCVTLPKMMLYQYIIGMVLLAVGYPVSSVICYSLYSKILGPTPQGLMMGILTAVGSLARIVGPLFVTFLYDLTGPQITFSSVIGLLALAICILTISCYRLVPYGTPSDFPKIIKKEDPQIKR